MPPKARPRARARQHDTSDSPQPTQIFERASTSKSVTPTHHISSGNTIDRDDDDDDFFMRNNGALWKKSFVRSTKRRKDSTDGDNINNSVITISSSTEESDSDNSIPNSSSPSRYTELDDGTIPDEPRRRNQKRARKIKQHPLPEWTNPKLQRKMKEIQETEENSNPRSLESCNRIHHANKQQNDKNDINYISDNDDDEERNSHIQLTPPPSTLAPRAPSQIYNELYEHEMPDEDFDVGATTDLNPALLAIRENLKGSQRQTAGVTNRGPENAHIKCKILQSVTDVEVQVGSSDHSKLTFPATQKTFKYRRSESFETMFKYLAKLLCTDLEGVVMTYEGHRVFTGATPESLNIYDEADMEAMTIETYQKIMQEKKRKQLDNVNKARLEEEEVRKNKLEQERLAREEEIERENQNNNADGSSDVEFVGVTQEHRREFTPPATSNIPNMSSPNRIRLTLRGANRNEEYKIQISKEKKCTVLLNSFLTYFKIDQGRNNSYKLDFDGEKLDLDTAIQDTDLEDEDLISVIKNAT
ncbi:hypothetical protein E3Q16_04312 [Wallemia mellicola]|uniref:Rad60/SUMO-like domain-containing protein n=1 Tax=Wallemia mellicola TaxID=1708541 RepID=A0AB74K7W2_9BASI|nr:hypothetical protein E3Q16_04312 [Wallemia mellicola]TIC57923.1 hypothetical protein E3Q03_04382 [Wallemia mellicola]